MTKEFELHPDTVRSRLRKESDKFPSCKLKESRLGKFKDFTSFHMQGPSGSADLIVVVNAESKSFEFSAGPYLHYEGDYPIYPPTLDFLDDLISAVVNGKVQECRYYYISPRINRTAKIVGVIPFSRHESFRFTRWFGLFSFFALRTVFHQYSPY